MLTFIETQQPGRRRTNLLRRQPKSLPPIVRLGYKVRYAPEGDSLVDHVKLLAVKTFVNFLATSPDDDGTFFTTFTVSLETEAKPLMLVGNAHGRVEDGHVIALYNPDRDLVDEVFAGCAYPPAILKEIVAKRCDLCIDVWVDAYKEDGVVEITRYVAREPRPATFLVR